MYFYNLAYYFSNSPLQAFRSLPTLGHYSSGRDNNLNLIRMIAAYSVLISHAFPLAVGRDVVEPLMNEIGFTLGSVAVYVFFIISGFLITHSFERSKSLIDFTLARILRIFPGLVVVLMVTIFVLGAAVTNLNLKEYFSAPETFSYFPLNLSLAKLQYHLPGVFELNPYSKAINGSLWTLFYEVVCYGGVAALGLMGLLTNNKRFLLAIALYFLAYSISKNLPITYAGHLRIEKLFHMSVPFFVGMFFYRFRRHIILNKWIALVCFSALVLTKPLNFNFETFCILLAYLVFYLGYVPSGKIRRYNQLGDYSYGVYIYAYPVQQTVVFLVGPMQPLTNIIFASLPTLCLAIISWHFVEKPSLGMRASLAARFREYKLIASTR